MELKDSKLYVRGKAVVTRNPYNGIESPGEG
jgi:hypothetical protein